MKVFISWSGDLSKQVAELLGAWIEDVLQGAQAWISSEDIEKGSIWFTDVANQLAETQFGILVLTRDNMDARWILFEAGALSKGLSKSRVCPLLVNFQPADLKPPLSQFNCATTGREDMLKLLRAVNSQAGASGLADDKLQKAFQKWWDDFADKLATVVKGFKPTGQVQRRPTEEILEEILHISRYLQASTQSKAPPPPLEGLREERAYLLRQLKRLDDIGNRPLERAVLEDKLTEVESEIAAHEIH